jgi:phosphatidylglycerophosphatase C
VSAMKTMVSNRDSVAAVPAPAVAIFDLDGTLTREDTFLRFLVTYAIRHRRPTPLAILPFVLGLYAIRVIADRTAKGCLVKVFCGGRATAEIDAHAGWFLENWVRGRLRPEVVEAMERRRAAGLRTILLSASPDLYVPVIGRALGFDDVVCTQIATVEGLCGGTIVGPNCKGGEKVEAIRRLLDRQEAPPGSFAYGDSRSDLPLLRWVDHGFLVSRELCRPVARVNCVVA